MITLETTNGNNAKKNVLIDMLEDYNNIKNDWYIEKIVKELRETI